MGAHVGGMRLQKLYQKVPELEKSTAVAVEKMRLEETARRKLEERLITVSPFLNKPTSNLLCTMLNCSCCNCATVACFHSWQALS